MEVLPDIHRFAIPIPINPLGTVNAYLLTSPEGCILIDVGWNAPESFDSMMRHLAEAGASLADLKYIVITHIHPDHYGLIGRVHEHTDARLVMHEIERSLLDSRYVHYEQLLESMDEWLRINGVPDDNRQKLAMGSLEVLGLVSVALPDLPVRGGEHLVLGDFDLEVIWTPGHSPGHICRWEAKRRDIRYAVEVEIEAWDRSGLLADIMNVVNETRVHATSCNAKVKKTKAQVRLCMEINDKAQLDDIVKRLSHLKEVISVGRATSPGDYL